MKKSNTASSGISMLSMNCLLFKKDVRNYFDDFKLDLVKDQNKCEDANMPFAHLK